MIIKLADEDEPQLRPQLQPIQLMRPVDTPIDQDIKLLPSQSLNSYNELSNNNKQIKETEPKVVILNPPIVVEQQPSPTDGLEEVPAVFPKRSTSFERKEIPGSATQDLISIVESVGRDKPAFPHSPSHSSPDSFIGRSHASPSSAAFSPASLSRRYRQKSEREVLVGTPVKEGHVNYMLMYDMLTGIRCNAKPIREAVLTDFTAAHKLAFDVTGNELTPSSKYDFKFKDYAPWIFRLIRNLFHVDPEDYLLSLTGKYVLSELISSGKSGSFFYYSQDYRFIIKTIHHSEHYFILKILTRYYNHIKNNPHTLLSRIFGLHRVKLPGNKKIHFVVMGNVFPSNKDIHEVYDLKGSLYGRKIPAEEAKTNPRAVMKDLNWLERERKMCLGPEKRAIFERQMELDVKFLISQKIMDYSLLVGVHDLIRGNQDHIRDQTLSVYEPNSETLSRRATASTRTTKAQIFKEGVRTDLMQLGPSTSKLPENVPPERRYCLFYADEGGFRGSDGQNIPLKEIYYLGIIDIFTFYSPLKRMETVFRSIGREKVSIITYAVKAVISAVDPIMYGNRFIAFMTKAVQGIASALTSDQNKRVDDVLAFPSGSFVQKDDGS